MIVQNRVICIILTLMLIGIIVFGAISLREYTYWMERNAIETEAVSDDASMAAVTMQWMN